MLEKRKARKRKAQEMEKIISDVLVVGDSDLKPYIEMLNYTPENITQKSLGHLLGFFEIKDESEDSAYIVNFLSSVIKKEYFINNKRGPIESFESSLNKVNLALAEIAKQGNVNWIGKLDSALCAIEENNIHFTTSGNGKVLLLRNGSFTEISQGLADSEDSTSDYLNPMKTFVNVSSGRLEDGDKIIITTDDIFHIFSMNEIKKSALQFSREKFVQFIKTALINELDIAGTIVIDINKRVSPIKESVSFTETEEINEAEINPFSSKVFEEKKKKRKKLKYTHKKNAELEEKSEEKGEYTDKKTGHIYLKENKHELSVKNENPSILREYLAERSSDFSYWIKNDLKRLLSHFARKTGTAVIDLYGDIKTTTANLFLRWKEKRIRQKEMAMQFSKARFSAPASTFNEASTSSSNNKRVSSVTKKITSLPEKSTVMITIQSIFKFIPFLFKRMRSALQIILPSLEKIKSAINKMSFTQKIYSTLILIAIIILPLVFRNYQNTENLSDNTETQAESPSFPLEGEKNIHLAESFEKIFTTETSSKLIVQADGELFQISENEISEISQKENQKKFTLPENFSKAEMATFMPDLRLIFILTDQKKIISFNTISKKFQENNFTYPDGAEIESLGTYLTYLYVLDSANDQIYRYPRAEGGFGEKTQWLKENIAIEKSSRMAIDENIYIANGDKITKFFQGKKLELSLEQSTTPINNILIFSSPQNEFLYIIDKENGRLIKLSKGGEIMSQYYDERIKSAENFIVDDNNSRAYLSLPDGIYSFNISK